MSEQDRKNQFGRILGYIAESLDISEACFKEAEERYQAVGKWLERDGSIVEKYNPVIYTQGSFRLGTVIKPVTDEEKYDIDLVCELNLTKNQVSQKLLKDLIGIEIKAYVRANNMKNPAKEARRCWTLNYADGTQFHMDMLPCVPDSAAFKLILESRGVPRSISDHAIAITDNTLPNYDNIDENWLSSNPKGYAEWFKERMKIQFEVRRIILAESISAKAEDVPDYKVKTTLQRAVQILKRHRDIMFEHNLDDKPISMIITTLAAHAYNNEADLYDALYSIIKGIPEYILSANRISWVPNPVNPQENFADKWQEHPQREIKFRKWLYQVREDLSSILEKRDLNEVAGVLRGVFGERTVNKSLSRYMEKTLNNKKSSSLVKAAPILPGRFNVSHKQGPRWPVRRSADVSIRARASRTGFRPFYFNTDSSPLPKHFSLRFEATTNVPQPFDVYWQVVNTGEEARRANCLRGTFYNGSGLVHTETTLYRGMHWVECFIVKNSVCVARSGEFVVNIE